MKRQTTQHRAKEATNTDVLGSVLRCVVHVHRSHTPYTSLCILIHPYTSLYILIHPYTSLYILIHPYTSSSYTILSECQCKLLISRHGVLLQQTSSSCIPPSHPLGVACGAGTFEMLGNFHTGSIRSNRLAM